MTDHHPDPLHDPLVGFDEDEVRATMIGALVQSVERLVDKLDVFEQRRKLDRRIYLVGIALVVALAVLTLIATIGLIYIANTNRENGERVRDCTTPGGQCFEESQQRTAGVVRLLLEQNVALVQCAKSTDTDAQLEACVAEKLTAAAAQ